MRKKLDALNIKPVFPVILIILTAIVMMMSSCTNKKDTVITYSLYPYLADCEYYQSVIEEGWKKIEPAVDLKYVDYNCYLDGAPDGIDVIMYDSMLEDEFVESGYLQPISDSDVDNIDDFFGYTINDIRKEGKLYGIPSILCSEVLIYDKESDTASNAECIQDMETIRDRFLVNVDMNYDNLYTDYLADSSGIYEPDEQDYETDPQALDYVKKISNMDYHNILVSGLAEAYRDGKCDAFLGYPESMSDLGERFEDTWLKNISMTENRNIPLYFADIIGLSSDVDGDKKEKCIKLMNLISSTDVMKKAAINDGKASYLIFPRDSFYEGIADEDELYSYLYELVRDSENRIYR